MSYLSPYYVYFATQNEIEHNGYKIKYQEMRAHSQDNLQLRILQYTETIIGSLGVHTIHAFRILTAQEFFVLRTHYAESEIDIPPYVETLDEFDQIFEVLPSEAKSETYLLS